MSVNGIILCKILMGKLYHPAFELWDEMCITGSKKIFPTGTGGVVYLGLLSR
jgi:hypothetical protein